MRALRRTPRGVYGVRRRVVTASVGVVAAALVLGAVALLVILNTVLSRATTETASTQATQIAQLVAQSPLPDVVTAVRTARARGAIIQLIDGSGRVLAASDSDVEATAMTTRVPAPGELQTQQGTGIPALDQEEARLVVSLGARGQDGLPYVVAVAVPTQVETDTIRTVVVLVTIASLLLLGLVYLVVRRSVDRSLEPVERIRGQVSRIGASRLGDRVDVPPSGDEIARLAETMNGMLARLQRSDEAKRAFVSDASHELRSPLATLRAALEVAQADASGSALQRSQDVLLSETLRMQLLVEDLLTLAKADDQGLSLAVVDVDLDDLLDAEVRRLRATTHLTVVADLDFVQTRADPDRLTQVLRNLLDNAQRHARSSIRVGLTRHGDRALVHIDNDGSPVPEAARMAIFDRFQRLDDSRARDSGGSGLGLAIAAELVRLHDGTLSTGETPDGWCRFEIDLPAA